MITLTNTQIEVLKLIHSNIGTTLHQNYCSLSQEEMGEYLGIPRREVSRMIVALTDAGYIHPRVGKVRRYALTNRGQGMLRRVDLG